MKRASTIISIPLYDGVNGSILEAPWMTDGSLLNREIHWIVPKEVAWPDGWGIYGISVVPKLQAYTGVFKFEIWDKYMLSKPKFIGSVKINSADDTYEVNLVPHRYCDRLTAQFTVTHSPRIPNNALAYDNNTPYGEWRYRDKI